MIPVDFIDHNRRLLWEFFFEQDGTPSAHLKEIMARPDFNGDFVRAALPYTLDFEWWDRQNDMPRVSNSWMRENIVGCWTLWGTGKTQCVCFEHATDAVFFKLTWC